MGSRMEPVWAMQRLVESNFSSPSLLRVEECLLIWGDFQTMEKVASGYARCDSTCQDASSSVQWQDSLEVAEDRSRGYISQAVEACVSDLPTREGLVLRAIYANDRGPQAWRVGPLAGLSTDKLKEVHLSAVRLLLPKLRRRGVGID